jgi:hypothetical protein
MSGVRQLMTLFLAGGVSFAMTFLSLGLFWIGLPAASVLLAAGYAAAALVAARASALWLALIVVLGSASPLCSILVRFRDAQDSHLLPVSLVVLWFGAAIWGAWIGADRTVPLRRIALVFMSASVGHALLSAALLMGLAADSSIVGELRSSVYPVVSDGFTRFVNEPAISALQRTPVRMGPAAQWVFLLANSANWGALLALLYCSVVVLRGFRSPPAL